MGQPHDVLIQESNGAIVDNVRCKGSSEIQDGCRHTGCTHNSAGGQDSDTVPTANLMFSESRIPMALWWIMSGVRGVQKSKMAAAIPEVPIAWLADNTNYHVFQVTFTEIQNKMLSI